MSSTISGVPPTGAHLAGGQGLHQAEGALTRAAHEVAAARADLTAIGTRLEGQLAGLPSQWSGAGGTAFSRVHLAWAEQQARIVSALDGFVASLQETEQATLAADVAQSAAMSQIASRLGGAA
ncbi:MAG: WXG100 family type VII secretion target [Nocardioides sp.]